MKHTATRTFGLVILAAASATSAQVPSVVARTGAPTPGSLGNDVGTLNDPYIDGYGRPGFTGSLTTRVGSIGFVWVHDGIAWLNTDGLPDVLTGGEGTCGIGDDGQWIYSPADDTLDSVWSNGSALLVDGDAAPGLPGMFITFASRPQMNADGTPTWISGTTTTPGGATSGRVLYAANVPLIKTGDVYGGLTVDDLGVGFAYDFSPSGNHWLVRARSGPSPFTFFMVRDGVNVLQTGQPASGAAGNWQNFDDCGINDAGNWVVSGDTDGPTASDGFVAYNGSVIASEGQTLDGLTLSSNPRAVSIANNGRIGAIWNTNVGEALYLFTQTVSGGWTAHVLVKNGDLVDTNGDGIGDSPITDFNAGFTIAPGLRLPDRCRVYVNVDITVDAVSQVAVISVPLPEPGLLGDLNGDGHVNGADLAIVLGGWSLPGSTDLNCDGTTDGADLAILLGAWTG